MMIGAGCSYRVRGGRLEIFEPGNGNKIVTLDFISAAAARKLNWEIATLAANLEEDHGPEEVRRLLSAEHAEQ